MSSLKILTEQYTQPHRKYHTLEHIAYMFNIAKEFKIELTEAQKLAIWWHDAVYTVGSSINENDSIVLMINTIGKQIDDSLLTTIVDIIWDTKHERAPRTEESAIVCDLDMYGFADIFDVNYRMQQQVYSEFRGHLSMNDFRINRIKFLQKLKGTPIFYSNIFNSYRGKAVHNIEKEIKDLKLLLDVN